MEKAVPYKQTPTDISSSSSNIITDLTYATLPINISISTRPTITRGIVHVITIRAVPASSRPGTQQTNKTGTNKTSQTNMWHDAMKETRLNATIRAVDSRARMNNEDIAMVIRHHENHAQNQSIETSIRHFSLIFWIVFF